jgi:hypothetical protein
MTRKSSISIILVLVGLATALAAAPATAVDNSGSVRALETGYQPDSAASERSDYPGSVTALAGGHDGDEQVSAPRAPYIGSVTALAGGHDGNSQPSSGSDQRPVISPSPRSDFQPLNGILGEDGITQPVPTASVADGDGFDWTDALIGALISSAALLMAYFTARSVARRRTSTAESRA